MQTPVRSQLHHDHRNKQPGPGLPDVCVRPRHSQPSSMHSPGPEHTPAALPHKQTRGDVPTAPCVQELGLTKTGWFCLFFSPPLHLSHSVNTPASGKRSQFRFHLCHFICGLQVQGPARFAALIRAQLLGSCSTSPHCCDGREKRWRSWLCNPDKAAHEEMPLEKLTRGQPLPSGSMEGTRWTFLPTRFKWKNTKYCSFWLC